MSENEEREGDLKTSNPRTSNPPEATDDKREEDRTSYQEEAEPESPPSPLSPFASCTCAVGPLSKDQSNQKAYLMSFLNYRQETIEEQEEVLEGLIKTGICEDCREKGRLNRVRVDSGKAAHFFNVLVEREEGRREEK